MISVQDIPETWCDLLQRVQVSDPLAVIAGGCLRDLENGRPINDIDIVVQCSTDLESVALKLGGGDIDTTSIESSAQDTNFSAECKFKLQDLENPINLIASAKGLDPSDKVQENDFGICQIMFNGSCILRTNAYCGDIMRRSITLCRCNSLSEWDAVKRHYLRISTKYEWPLVIPYKFAQAILTNTWDEDLFQ